MLSPPPLPRFQTGPAPTRSIRRRVEEEASQVRRKYLLEVAAKDAERAKAVEARKVSLAKEAEARAALRETQKAERQRLFEERERLRYVTDSSPSFCLRC